MVAIAYLWICTSHCTLRLPFDIARQLISVLHFPASYLIGFDLHVTAFPKAAYRWADLGACRVEL